MVLLQFIDAVASVTRYKKHGRHPLLLKGFVDDHPQLATAVRRLIVNNIGVVIGFKRALNHGPLQGEGL